MRSCLGHLQNGSEGMALTALWSSSGHDAPGYWQPLAAAHAHRLQQGDKLRQKARIGGLGAALSTAGDSWAEACLDMRTMTFGDSTKVLAKRMLKY